MPSRRQRSKLGPTIEGRRPVLEALRAGREIERLLVAEGIERGPQIEEIIELAGTAGIEVQTVDRGELDRGAHTKHHQGIVALVQDVRYTPLEDLLALASERHETPLIVVLDGIEDPQNLGAIIRTLECAGGHGVVIAERRAVGVTPGVIRASAGATEHVKVARVTNLARTLDQLKEAGLWIFGLDAAGDRLHWETDFKVPAVLVVGSEGEGISRLVREKCDFLVRLPLRGKVESLNASVAAAVALYEIVRQRSGGA
ncbi:MAG: 23S rRNA (guanosine(2251)-2'-O)-methyltransferase RlmB [Chloroflexi bacterium]|nr:23S rRNA (guanosine(2251)-2'-O)-methyltransferase RlmB [Chloroflexota bacterium]